MFWAIFLYIAVGTLIGSYLANDNFQRGEPAKQALLGFLLGVAAWPYVLYKLWIIRIGM
jgi:hypothetical protein